MIAPDHSRPSAVDGAGGEPSNLALRLASAAVLVPVALWGAYAGGGIFVALVTVVALVALAEWTAMTADRLDRRTLLPGAAALIVAAVLVATHRTTPAFAAIALGAIAAAAANAAAVRGIDAAHGGGPGWAAAGVGYAGVALLGPTVLRGDPVWGLTALLFLFATVWVTDTCAYFGGRMIGGPPLWPSVSPKKTWAGAIAGLIGGIAAGVAVAYAGGVANLWMVSLVALVLSLLAQAGDLLESAVKRRFGAKDASHLIPGHGGMMDRIDGFLIAAFAALVVGLARAGEAAPARGFLVW